MDCKGSSWKGSFLPLVLLLCLLPSTNASSQEPSRAVCASGDSGCRKALQNFFNTAIFHSGYMSILTSQLFRELEASYANAPWHFTNEVSPCHTASIATPGKAQAKKMLVSRSPSFPRPKRAATNSTMRLAKETLRKFPELFTLTMRILRSWTGPLSHLVKNFKSPPSIANRAKLLEQESKQLLRDMEKIAGRVTHKAVPKKDFNTWPELTSLLSTDWTARLLAVYNLARCIKADAQRIDSYTKILRCQFKETC